MYKDFKFPDDEAKKDFEIFNSAEGLEKKYVFYEIHNKVLLDENYENNLSDEIAKFHKKNDLPMPVDNFISSKLDGFKKVTENLNEPEKQSFEQKFNEKLTAQKNKEINDTALGYDEKTLHNAIHEFVKNIQYNDKKMEDNTKYMLSYMKDKPYEFNAFSENFVTSGTIKNGDLPENIKNIPPQQANKFSRELNKSVVQKAKELSKLSNLINGKNEIGELLQNYRKEQFKGLYQEVKKSNELKYDISIKNSKSQGMRI